MLPELFCEKMKRLLGEEYEAFLAALDRPRAVGLRLNSLKLCPSERSEESVPRSKIFHFPFSIFNLTPVPWEPTGFYYDPETRPGLHPYHAAGAYYLQEPSAMAPVALLNPRPGERILDLCAAPGGKSTQIAGRMMGEGLLVCNEIHPKRAGILASNVERLGIANALVLNEHPARLAERFPEAFDRILVDAPCSGEGMFRKHDAAFEDWSPETVAMCARRQAEILDCAAAMLRPGGRLVYSTCTFSPEENEGSAAALLERNPELYVEEVQAPWFAPGRPDWAKGDPALAKTFRLWPHRLKGEGHFAAVLRKKTAGAEETAPACTGAAGRGTVAGFIAGAATELAQAASAAGGLAARPAEARRQNTTKSSEYRNPAGSRPMAAAAELPRPVKALLSELEISLPAGKPVVFGERVFWAPPETPELAGLKVLRPGLELAELRRELAAPAHALALWAKAAASVHALSAGDPACAAYLRGETIPTDCGGWTLVTVDGLSLGWGKGVKGVLKNHYPKGLRITG